MNLLLISNSTMPGEPFLDYPKSEIKNFIGNQALNIVFIPYAAITFSYNEYEQKVIERFNEIGHTIKSIHHFNNPIKAITDANCIVVGGGNTWQLTRLLREKQLLQTIRKKVLSGTPYIGWSAGANIACPSIKTTNDMPIIDPLGFDALSLVSFQINPHYLDANPNGHAGETRQQRIEEFLELNQQITVAGLREGTMLKLENNQLKLIGNRSMRIFNYNKTPFEVNENDDLSFLI
ncbi:MAG TPA: dipeptidase PepE [Prolixibacteraceae bacterium]|nr:dipeptidase PepE [Prolixibacteraceae bacterium]